ncbi:MAG: beta-galactosidase trimerization domain-containing protein [Terriglobia bacterium]
MAKLNRRELLQRAGAAAAATTLGAGLPPRPMGAASRETTGAQPSSEWWRSPRLLIAEGYDPPFYPPLDYQPEKALAIARELHCDSIRFPTFSYVAYFPTQTKLPRHPELGSRDLLRTTVEVFHGAGLKVVAYNPLNHPFMDVRSHNPEYQDWMRHDVYGKPMVTSHMGWADFYEGCLNSPLRLQVRERVREVISNYPVDAMYFDGPYQGMQQASRYCHCKYCKAAYWQARGKDIPLENGETSREDEIEYRRWLSEEVVGGYMHEICDMVRGVRNIPIVYNDTALLSKESWRGQAFKYVDGFMFESSSTPEQKLFNMRLGQSTGKAIWTYVSSYAEYNCEHVKDKSMRGWYSFPLGGQTVLLDAAVATAAEVGYCYWGLNRVYYLPDDMLSFESVRGVKDVFAFADRHSALLRSVKSTPQVGIVTGAQTIEWYQAPLFLPRAYGNYYDGAYQLIKSLSYDAEPFLDYQITPERLKRFKLVYLPNVPCLSDAQCSALSDYVEHGGVLLATHLTSAADEYGQPRKDYGLSSLFGATLRPPRPVEHVDLYLKLPSGKLIPQDPQVMPFQLNDNASVLAETYSRGDRKILGPAIIRRQHGMGQVIYIGSGLEAVYEETLNDSFRKYFQSLLDPILRSSKTYEVEFHPGLTHQFAVSRDVLLLHLLANTGNIWKEGPAQEWFLPVRNVRVRIRLPENRSAQSVELMWSGTKAAWSVRKGWVELTVPQVEIYEIVRVNLA